VLVQTKPVDFVNEQWALMRIGTAYGEYAWTGVMQYDSVIAGPTPAPSRLELSGTGALTVGVCDSVKLAMTESFTGAAASLPWPTLIDLQVQGAAVFSDAGCTSPASSIIAVAGVPYLDFSVRPTQLSLQVVARSPELMPISFQIPVAAASDAGSTDGGFVRAPEAGDVDGGYDGRRTGVVGCGCTTTGPEWLLLAVLARRRSARRAHR